jgi:hypothetical protein
MAKYKISVALLCGAGFASVLVLLLNLKVLMVSVAVGILLLPGSIATGFLWRSSEFSPPLAILAANAAVYSAIAYAIVSAASRNIQAATMRLATIKLAAPAAILLSLACIPALNRLWPRGITELTKQEQGLRGALPLGMGLDGARAVLLSKGIQFHEETLTSQSVILDDGKGGRIIAFPGERVLSTRLQTQASQFPCAYDIQVVLLFGQDEKIREQHIQRFPICP